MTAGPRGRTATDAIARRWLDAVRHTAPPVDPAALRARLDHACARLGTLLTARSFEPTPARAVGAELVAAGITTPEALGATIEVLGDTLPTLAGRPVDATRLIRLLAELTVGFNRALGERTWHERADAHRSVQLAQIRADRAVQESEQRLQHAALHDALTGLPNRALFAERLYRRFGTAGPGARIGICAIDIDGFKAVNDQFGHQLGDLVLVAVADRLRRLAEETGHLVARFGGDEFAVLVAEPGSADDVVRVADQVLTMLAAPVRIDGHTVATRASVGVVERAVADGDPTDLLRAADMTLHWAKADPDRSWHLYDGERSAREVARYALLADLPAALAGGQIVPYYQPLVRLADRQVVGVEALARWQHPHLGVLGPDSFIPSAEESGLIVPLGAALLRDACRTAAGWAAAGTGEPWYVSVNVAVRQLRAGGLVQTVADILADCGLPPGLLQLEITESDSVDQDSGTHASLQELAALGVRLAIDDFGSGYSNLGYLQEMPLHQLKIDSRFLGGTPAAGRSLLPTLVDLAHSLDMTALVEGVETAEQAAYLTGIGCDLGQGWFFGRPRPPGTFPHPRGR